MGFDALLRAAGASGLAEFPGGPTMIALPGGRFAMGSPGEVLTERRWWDVELPNLHGAEGLPPFFTPMEWEEVRHLSPWNERPRHEVTLPSFALGKFAVTFEQWDACAADGFCRAAPPTGPAEADRGSGCGRRPVVNVSWNDVTGADGAAKGLIRWLNCKAVGDETAPLYRLPTEAEWEFAARAGSESSFDFGEDARPVDDDAWGVMNAGRGPRRVGEKTPNRWGLHDMYGNVGEWVQDCWHDNYLGAPVDGSVAWMDAGGGDCARAVTRGHPGFAEGMRPAVRGSFPRNRGSRTLGLRVARRLTPRVRA